MKSPGTRVAPLIALLGLACDGGHHDDASLEHYSQEVTRALDQIEASATSHHEQILEADNLAQVRGLELEHVDEMSLHTAMMRDAQQSIARCAENEDSATHDDAWQSMHDADDAMGIALDDLGTEMHRHAAAMNAATGLDGALAEERTHRSAVGPMMEEMRMRDEDMMDAMNTMSERGGSMMCATRTHMHR